MSNQFFTSALLALCAAPAFAQTQARSDPLGDALRIVVPAGAAALSYVRDDTEGLKGLGYTLLLSQGTTAVLKHTIDSERPDGSGQGFPSGHASMVFASAGYVHQRYGWRDALPFYGLATVTAWSRVHTDNHFTKDVVGGAVVGLGSAFLVGHWMGPRATASVSYGSGGVQVQYARVFD